MTKKKSMEHFQIKSIDISITTVEVPLQEYAKKEQNISTRQVKDW